MTNNFTGFGFLQAALHPVSDVRRGFGLGGEATPDFKRGYGLNGAATPDMSAPAKAIGSATTVDTTQHSTGTYMALPQS